LNILLISYEFPPEMATGGIGFYINHLATILTKAGHGVTVFSASNHHSEITIVKRYNCINYLIPAKGLETFRYQVLELFKSYILDNKVDVIESPEVGACALTIKEEYPGIPLIVKMHSPGVLITKVSNSYQPISKKLRFILGALKRGKIDLGYWSKQDKNRNTDPEFMICNKANYLLSPTLALKKWALNYWKINESKISVIPNPFSADDELYEFPIKNREKLICFVGKLTVLKGMISLTPAILTILENNPEYSIVFAGRDEAIAGEMTSMQAFMESKLKPVLNRVKFLGASDRKTVKDIYKTSQICVVPSLWENYPTVVLEAMSAGCALAASKRGGIPELIKDQKTGVLFNPLNSTSISTAIQFLIDNNSEREAITLCAREWVRANSKIVENQIVNAYNSILKK
jgi:glycogen synthase